MSERKRYRQAYDGDWIRPVRRGYRTACCDCGLVHRYDFAVVEAGGRQEILYRVRRDYRATAGRRRAKRLAKIKRALAE